MPIIRLLAAVKVNIKAGIAIIVAIAVIFPHSVPASVRNNETATGRVLVNRLVRTRLNINSFHDILKVNIPATAIPGAMSGRIIRVKTTQSEHPSIIADSSREYGISEIKVFSTQILNGRFKAIKQALNQAWYQPYLLSSISRK